MALFNCPDCGNVISDKATSCPKCGFILSDYLKNQKYIDSLRIEAAQEAYRYVKRKTSEIEVRIIKEKAELARREEEYRNAIDNYNSNSSSRISCAKNVFLTLGDYKKSQEYYDKCDEKIESARKREKKINKYIFVTTCIVALIILISVLVAQYGVPYIKNYIDYRAAKTMLANQDFDGAEDAFKALGEFKDSEDMIKESLYEKAVYNRDNGRFSDAEDIFNSLGDYSDSVEQIKETRYQEAIAFLENEETLDDAIEQFTSLGDYSDSKTKLEEGLNKKYGEKYNKAMSLYNQKDYVNAEKAFRDCDEYKDSQEKANECEELFNDSRYSEALASMSSGDYKHAAALFDSLGDYKDSADQYKNSQYSYANSLMDEGEYYEAISAYSEIKGMTDALKGKREATYMYLTTSSNLSESEKKSYAYDLYSADYKDSRSKFGYLFKWKASFLGANTSDYGKTYYNSLSVYDEWVMHFKISDGPPGESVKVYCLLVFPDGGTLKSNTITETVGGEFSQAGFYEGAGTRRSGNFTIKIYTSDGEVIGQGSVYVS